MVKLSKTYNTVQVCADSFGGVLNYGLSSKSQLHRALICAALSDGATHIACKTEAEDVFATIECLRALGARIVQVEDGFKVLPIDKSKLVSCANLDVKESGSTFRFLLPVVCALGINSTLNLNKRLSKRPIQPLIDELIKHGANIYWDENDKTKLHCKGKITGRQFSLNSLESSQFISGILLALPLLGGGNLKLCGNIESKPYVAMTAQTMREFGIDVCVRKNEFTVSGQYKSLENRTIYIEPDWSNAAFWLCAGAISKNGASLQFPCRAAACETSDECGNNNSNCASNNNYSNCNTEINSNNSNYGTSNSLISSLQGDAIILEILERFGAHIQQQQKHYAPNASPEQHAQQKICAPHTTREQHASHLPHVPHTPHTSPAAPAPPAPHAASHAITSNKEPNTNLHAICIDASDIPDLVPAIALVATAAQGTTHICDIGRLRLKESDRLDAIYDVLSKLGANVQIKNNNELIICGPTKLHGAYVSSHNDHRIAMLAACASIVCSEPVTIECANAVNKSYPSFFNDFETLGGKVKVLK